MNYIDTKYIGLVSSQLLKFTEKKKGTYNFRCPYCGDSEKKQNKARGYLFSMRDSFVYKCHNCGVTRNFSQFLKDQSVNLHDEYVMERYKEGMTGKNYQVKTPDFKPFVTKPVFKKNIFSELPSIDSLNITHPAKQYLLDRKIPESFYSNFYYAEDFNAWENNQNTIKEPRIILPLISEDGNVFGYQARSLNKNATLRYITTILDKQYPKLFGLDRINKNENIYITEGPFDSLFIRNSLAMCGADVHLGDWGIDNATWIYDNEPRNKQIVERINKTIQHGNKVVIWPDSIKEKDINDMFLAGHNVQSVVECNTYSGLEAQVKFNLWKKI
jgi:DNA-directed RNA polymerase subunit RPC12/RpoP